MMPSLQPFLSKVTTGKDLTPHLSNLVKKGIILPGARPTNKGKDIDTVLTRQGLHHFHIGNSAPGDRTGRSSSLVFAEVLETEFRVVAIADHRVFARGSAEQLRFFQICHSYMAKDIPPGQAFMANPVMVSGHSMVVALFARKCEDEVLRLDPLLDDSVLIDKLYKEQPILRDGKPVARPVNPSMAWHFEDLRFGILDRLNHGVLLHFSILCSIVGRTSGSRFVILLEEKRAEYRRRRKASLFTARLMEPNWTRSCCSKARANESQQRLTYLILVSPVSLRSVAEYKP